MSNPVYVLFYLSGDKEKLVGIYSTFEKAEERRNQYVMPSHLSIDEWYIDFD